MESNHIGNDTNALLQNDFANNSLLINRSIEATVSTEVEWSQPTSGFTRYSIEQSVDEPKPVIIVYKRRWYVLVIFCLVCATQGGKFEFHAFL